MLFSNSGVSMIQKLTIFARTQLVPPSFSPVTARHAEPGRHHWRHSRDSGANGGVRHWQQFARAHRCGAASLDRVFPPTLWLFCRVPTNASFTKPHIFYVMHSFLFSDTIVEHLCSSLSVSLSLSVCLSVSLCLSLCLSLSLPLSPPRPNRHFLARFRDQQVHFAGRRFQD